jgi:uncharacterized membrane protein YidH (DUF202 family)
MNQKVRYLGLVLMLIGVVAIAMGIVFVQQGFAKAAFLTEAMEQEQITLGGVEGIDGFIDTAEEAQIAGDTVRGHRHSIAPTYGELLGGKQFDPTNPTQLSYAQALNLENYLYLAVASFGVFTMAKAMGAFMIAVGIGLGATGFVFWKTTKSK